MIVLFVVSAPDNTRSGVGMTGVSFGAKLATIIPDVIWRVTRGKSYKSNRELELDFLPSTYIGERPWRLVEYKSNLPEKTLKRPTMKRQRVGAENLTTNINIAIICILVSIGY